MPKRIWNDSIFFLLSKNGCLKERDFIPCHIRENNVLPFRTGFLNLMPLIVFRNNHILEQAVYHPMTLSEPKRVVSLKLFGCWKWSANLIPVVEYPCDFEQTQSQIFLRSRSREFEIAKVHLSLLISRLGFLRTKNTIFFGKKKNSLSDLLQSLSLRT